MILYQHDSDLTSSCIQPLQDNKYRTWAWLLIKLYECHIKRTVVPTVTQCVCYVTSLKY
jgi:hypothetical protein